MNFIVVCVTIKGTLMQPLILPFGSIPRCSCQFYASPNLPLLHRPDIVSGMFLILGNNLRSCSVAKWRIAELIINWTWIKLMRVFIYQKSRCTLLDGVEVILNRRLRSEVSQWNIGQQGAVLFVPSARMKWNSREQQWNVAFFVKRIAHKWAIELQYHK